MIVSHKHRFIFIHCRKVAGSSMKVALARHLGPDDLVIGSLHEILAAQIAVPEVLENILRRPVSRAITLGARALGKSCPEAQNISVKRHFSKQLGSDPPHASAEKTKAFLADVWPSYTKFCFVRNPFEKMASDFYFYSRVSRKRFTFEEFVGAHEFQSIRSPLKDGIVTNWEQISIGDKLVVDHVGRYERLQHDFDCICLKLKLPRHPLGNEKVTSVSDRSRYGELYSPTLRDRVATLCAAEIDAFGYEFPF
jgi:hypothetical protein